MNLHIPYRTQWVQIPKIYIDETMAELTFSQFKVLMYISRKILGWADKEQDIISMEQITKGVCRKDGTVLDRGTAISPSTAYQAVSDLIQLGLIQRIQRGTTAHPLPPMYTLVFAEDPPPIPATPVVESDKQKDHSGHSDPLRPTGVDHSGPPECTIGTSTIDPGYYPPTPLGSNDPQKTDPSQQEAAEPAAYPDAAEESLDLNDPIHTFATNLYRRNGRPRLKINAKSSRLRQSLEVKEADAGAAEFRLALVKFIQCEDAWLQENGWPLPAFLKDWHRYEADYSPRSAIPARPVRLSERKAPRVTPTTPESRGGPEIDFFTIWKEHGPGKDETPPDPENDNMRDIAACAANSKFVENFKAVCVKAKAIRDAGGGDVGWLSYRWLLKESNGVRGWWKVYTGDLDWMLKKAQTSGARCLTMSDGIAEARRLNWEKAEKQKAEREKAAAAENGKKPRQATAPSSYGSIKGVTSALVDDLNRKEPTDGSHT